MYEGSFSGCVVIAYDKTKVLLLDSQRVSENVFFHMDNLVGSLERTPFHKTLYLNFYSSSKELNYVHQLFSTNNAKINDKRLSDSH